jgi:hypothetical protein
VHNEICKDQFKDQMIVVSLSACTYASNDSGQPYQGINGVVRATDKQHIFSNKSDNLYTIQRCDLTKDSMEDFGGYSYTEFDILHKSNAAPPRGIHIMAVGDDPKSESATLDIRHVVPPGTETASILSVGRGRSGVVPTGADMVVAYPSQSDSNNVTTNAQARVIVFNRDSNPLTPPASGLEQSLSNHTQVTGNAYFNEDMKSRSDLESAQLREDLKSATISEPGSTDALIAAHTLQWPEVPLEHFSEYHVLTPLDRGRTHSTQQHDIPVPTAEFRLNNGDGAEQQASLIQSAIFADHNELRQVNDNVSRIGRRHGQRYTEGVQEFLAESIALNSEAISAGEPGLQGAAATFIQRGRQSLKTAEYSKSDFPAVPIDFERAAAVESGRLRAPAPTLVGGINNYDHRVRSGVVDGLSEAEQRRRAGDERRQRERERKGKFVNRNIDLPG